MGTIFFKVMEMSIAALLLMVAVVILRLPLKKAPKWFMGILWAIVALRLIIPVQVTAHVGFMPDFGRIVNACFNKGKEVQAVPAAVNSGVHKAASGIPIYVVVIWIVGMMLVLGYAVVSFIMVKRKIAASIRYISGDRVYVCDDIDTPFIFGLLKPSIYMPSGLDDKTIKNVLAHEMAHIERYDHIRKQFGFLILAIHWFNPLVWVSYILFCKDIELACDERVVSRMTLSEKKSYAKSLLSCSTHGRMVLAYPLAFGEVGVGTRVKQIFNYKKPTAWLIAGLVVIRGILSTSSFTKAADKSEIARIPVAEVKEAEVIVEADEAQDKIELEVYVPERSRKVNAGIIYQNSKNEYSTKVTEQGATVQTENATTAQSAVKTETQPETKSEAKTETKSETKSVTVTDSANVEVVANENVQVEAGKETVAVSVSDGNENVAVKTDSQTVQNGVGLVGEVLGGVDQMISTDPVLNQVVNETVNEVVDEVYEEVVNDVCDEVVDEVFDEIIDEGLGGLFGILH